MVKYHYLLLYLSLVLFAILNSVATINSAMFVLLIVFTIGWIILVVVNKHYLRRLHTVRAAINGVVLVVFMILMIVQSVNVSSPQQNSGPAIVGLVFLYGSVLFNSVVFVRNQYRRRKKERRERKSNRVKNAAKVHL